MNSPADRSEQLIDEVNHESLMVYLADEDIRGGLPMGDHSRYLLYVQSAGGGLHVTLSGPTGTSFRIEVKDSQGQIILDRSSPYDWIEVTSEEWQQTRAADSPVWKFFVSKNLPVTS